MAGSSEDIYFIVETEKTVEQACASLTEVSTAHKFGVLAVHDLGDKLRSKGQDFKEQVKVFEICNPVKAFSVLQQDIRMNMALPCRISVYSEGGKTKIGMISPAAMLQMLSTNELIAKEAAEVEVITKTIITEAAK